MNDNDDLLPDLKGPLSRALDLSEDDFAKMSWEVKNLLGVRRKLGNTWLDDFEVVVEVLDPKGCGCGVKAGDRVVFDMRHRIKPELSTATLCMHMLAPILAVFYMTFDRASEGLNPISRIWRFFDCVDRAADDGAGKARTRVFLRTSDTHEEIDVHPMKTRAELRS